MDKLKIARKPLRAILEATCNSTETELAKNPPDADLQGILVDNLGKIEDLEVKISELDTQILEKALEGTDPENDYEAEMAEIDPIQDTIRTIKRKIRQTIAPASAHAVVVSSSSVSGKKSYKLPKIEIRKFSGKLTDYMGWWAQFEKIHTDDELHPSDKFQYLVQATEEGSRARKLVEGYPQTATNYPKAVAAINDRFGDKVLLTEFYVRQLARMVIANASKSSRPSLSTMYDELESSLRALESLGVTTSSSAAFLYPLVESSLPEELLKVWQRSSLSGYDEEAEDTPVDKRLNSLMKFLRQEVKGAERLSFVSAGLQVEQKERRRPHNDRREEEQPTAASLFSGVGQRCIFCEKSHESKECSKGSSMSLNEKRSKVEKNKSCYVCLKPGHGAKSCRSFVKCVVCGKKHYAIVCPELSTPRHDKKSGGGEASASTSCAAMTTSGAVYLQTLRIQLKGPKGTKVVRALLDDGSERSYVLSSTAKYLGSPVVREEDMIHAVFGGVCGELEHHSIHSVDIMYPDDDKKRLRVHLYDKDQICLPLPLIKNHLMKRELSRRGITLSDYGHGSQEIEVLFGADLYYKLLEGRMEKVGTLLAFQTRFGWTILGKHRQGEGEVTMSNLLISTSLSTLDVDKLWRLDNLGITDPIEQISQEERDTAAKMHFLNNVTRDKEGRYCIALPWSNGEQLLPSNRGVAFKRLESTTKKLKDFNKYEAYNNMFCLWLSEGLIELTELKEEGCHYLPHRAVFKPESRTTPVRPVFDASCKSSRHPSLNDCLHKGPNEIQLIPSVLHRFRRNAVGVVADIRKAYQMISVREEDRRFLQFLWWNEKGQVIAYRHRRVVFGVNCSAFLLASVLEHHLSQCSIGDKTTAQLVQSSLYVDNLVCSLVSQEGAKDFKERATQLLSTAKMELREWEWTTGESSGVGLATDGRCGLGLGSRGSHDDRREESSVLGLQWDKVADTLSCDIQLDKTRSDTKVTKRTILSSVAKIFDPVGWCCPATLIPKIILQQIWAHKCSWEDEVPKETAKEFLDWASEIKFLKLIAVPRYAFQGECGNKLQLHTFTDASQRAYAAVTFVRVEDDCGIVRVQLLQARSKVAPIKPATIPRLELMGCLIGSRLYKGVREALKENTFEEFFWTDSTVALAWVRRNDNWGTFVGYRVKEIITVSDAGKWNYVPGELNPADLPSRGCSPSQLLESRWWEGPEWLKGSIETWPRCEPPVDEEIVLSERKKTPVSTLISSSTEKPWYVRRYSSYRSNLRVFCFLLRFIQKCRKRSNCTGSLTVGELQEGEEALFGLVQRESFPKNKTVIEGLRVIHADGLYRVHTKLFNREDSEDFRRPIVLPSGHPLTEQLVRHEHRTRGHAGVQAIVTSLRERVWIVRSRKTVKGIIGRCVLCRRFTAKPGGVPVASLPRNRVRDAKAFEVTGVDLAGPLHLKCGKKTWIVIFTCAVYRCIHLELVESLSTEDFLLALQRFVCRRGRPVTIYSDNGTNFVGSNNLFESINWKKVEEESCVQRIQWIFNPPSAAWWGGFWERLIRIVKDLLKRMLGQRKIGLKELGVLLCEVESHVNGRPLTYVSEDQDDLVPLTPQMFLTELRETTVPEVAEMTGTRLRLAVKKLGTLREELKSRFRKEYLAELVHRGKTGNVTIAVGDVVLVGNDLQKRIFWPMGKVIELLRGVDGQTRVAKIKLKEGILTRPMQRLYPLEVSSKETTPSPETETNQEQQEEETIVVEAEKTITRSGRTVKKPDRLKF